MKSFFAYRKFADKKFFFRVQKLGWRIVGFWPGSDVIHKYQIVFAIFNCIQILIYGVFQINYCIANRDKLVLLLDTMTPMFTQITTAMKILFLIWKRKEVKMILDYLEKSFYRGELRQ